MIDTNKPQAKKPRRVCIRCGDANGVSLTSCAACGFDLTSDLQQDYDLYRHGVPLDAPAGVGERAPEDPNSPDSNQRRRASTEPGTGSTTWRPYRDQSHTAVSHDEEPAKATMDLGAAVLAAVFEGGPTSSKSTLDIAALGPLLLEGASLSEIPDPVAWTPSSAPRVETPVVVGASTERIPEEPPLAEDTAPPILREEERPKPRVVGAVQDWVGVSTVSTTAPRTRPMGSSPGPRQPATRPPSTPATSEIPTRTDIPRQPKVSEPISQRNHIKVGATTYLDDVQTGFRRRPLSWWHHEHAMPFAVATGLVTLLLFALM
jgi:hypothetical protein